MYRLQIPHSEFTVLWVLFCSLITWLISILRKCPVSLTPSQAKVSSSVPLELPIYTLCMCSYVCCFLMNDEKQSALLYLAQFLAPKRGMHCKSMYCSLKEWTVTAGSFRALESPWEFRQRRLRVRFANLACSTLGQLLILYCVCLEFFSPINALGLVLKYLNLNWKCIKSGLVSNKKGLLFFILLKLA